MVSETDNYDLDDRLSQHIWEVFEKQGRKSIIEQRNVFMGWSPNEMLRSGDDSDMAQTDFREPLETADFGED